MAGGQGFEPR